MGTRVELTESVAGETRNFILSQLKGNFTVQECAVEYCLSVFSNLASHVLFNTATL